MYSEICLYLEIKMQNDISAVGKQQTQSIFCCCTSQIWIKKIKTQLSVIPSNKCYCRSSLFLTPLHAGITQKRVWPSFGEIVLCSSWQFSRGFIHNAFDAMHCSWSWPQSLINICDNRPTERRSIITNNKLMSPCTFMRLRMHYSASE